MRAPLGDHSAGAVLSTGTIGLGGRVWVRVGDMKGWNSGHILA